MLNIMYDLRYPVFSWLFYVYFSVPSPLVNGGFQSHTLVIFKPNYFIHTTTKNYVAPLNSVLFRSKQSCKSMYHLLLC